MLLCTTGDGLTVSRFHPGLNGSTIRTSSLMMITESPFPIKGRSRMVFRYLSCRTLPPYASLSARFGYPTLPFNAFASCLDYKHRIFICQPWHLQ